MLLTKKNTNTITLYNILSTLILQGLSFISSPIISRMLGTENYGIASVYITWVSLFATVFGIQTQSTIAVAKNEFGDDEQRSYQSSILGLSLCTYLICSVIILSLSNSISKLLGLQVTIVLLTLVQGFGQLCVTFINIKFTYDFNAGKNFILTLIVSISSLSLSFLLILMWDQSTNYWGRIIGQAIPYFVLGVAICVYVFALGKTFFSKKYWMFCLSLCLPIVVHNISNLILNQSDRVMILAISGSSAAGIYSLAYNFASVLSSIWYALNNSWVPFYYEYTRQNDTQKLMYHAHNYLELFTVLACGFVLFYNEVYHIFAGSEFWEGTKLISIFSIGFYFMFLYSFPVNYEFYHKKTRLIAVGTILAALINIVLNYIWINSFSIYGAAFATMISYGFQFAFHHICASWIIAKGGGNYPFKFKLFLPYCICFFIVNLFSSFFNNLWILRWLIGFALGLFELFRIVKRKAIF